MTPHSIIEFQEFLKEQEAILKKLAFTPLASKTVELVFQALQAELDLRLEVEGNAMAKAYGEAWDGK